MVAGDDGRERLLALRRQVVLRVVQVEEVVLRLEHPDTGVLPKDPVEFVE